MNALQLHYTSCRKGRGGFAGYQVRTLSPGITADEEREIARRGSYVPPMDSNVQLPYDELRRTMPIALRYFGLSSGRWAVTRSVYAGTDYTGRQGNFFAHSLVSDPAALDCWPIDLFAWEGWKDRLAQEEDTDQVPDPLPAVDLASVEPKESFPWRCLQEFLAKVPERPELLVAMIRALFLSKTSARAIVVRDTNENGLCWIACIQKVFPIRFASEVSFSSYQYDMSDCAAVNVTTGSTRFLFNDMERRFQFYEFDIAAKVQSEIDGPRAEDFPRYAVSWLIHRPEVAEKFHRFLELFPGVPFSADLGYLAAIHDAGFSSGKAPSAEAIAYADAYVADGERARALRPLVERLAALDGAPFERILAFVARDPDASARANLLGAMIERAPQLTVHHLDHILSFAGGLPDTRAREKILARLIAAIPRETTTPIPRVLEFAMDFATEDARYAILDRITSANTPFDRTALRAILDFASSLIAGENRARTLDLVDRLIADTPPPWPSYLFEELIRFSAADAVAHGDPQSRRQAIELALGMFDQFVTDGRGELSLIAKTLTSLDVAFAQDQREFAERFADPTRWRNVADKKGLLQPGVLEFALSRLIDDLVLLGCLQPWPPDMLAAFLDALIDRTNDRERAALFERLVRSFGNRPAEIADFVAWLGERAIPTGATSDERERDLCDLGRVLSPTLDRLDAGLAAAVRTELSRREPLHSVLFGEWLAVLAAAREPVSAYDTYLRRIRQLDDAYRHEHHSAIAESLLQRLDSAGQRAMALRWLDADNVKIAFDEFHFSLRRTCLLFANEAISLSQSESRQMEEKAVVPLATRMRRLSRECGVALDPDWPALWDAIETARDSWRGESRAPLPSDLTTKLARVDAHGYGRFLDLYLESAMRRALRRHAHEELIRSARVAKYEDLFTSRYRDALSAFRGNIADPAFAAAVVFCIRTPDSPDDDSNLRRLREDGRATIDEILVMSRAKHLARLNALLEAELPGTTREVWENLMAEVTAGRRSWKSRLRRFPRLRWPLRWAHIFSIRCSRNDGR